MKGVRILQLVLLVLLALYLAAFNNANPGPVTLPLLPELTSVAPVIVVIVALVGAWLVGWLPWRVVAWRRGRENRRLRQQLAEMEGRERRRAPEGEEEAPIIPDRFPVIPDRPPPRDEETEAS